MDSPTRDYRVPEHVPAELVVDVDMYDIPGGREDAQGAWLDLGTKGDLSWSPRNGGHWIATTADAVFELLRDAKHFSSTHVAIPKLEGKLSLRASINSRLLPPPSDHWPHRPPSP